jgi:hypothetical protein
MFELSSGDNQLVLFEKEVKGKDGLNFRHRVTPLRNVDDDELVGIFDAVVEVSEGVEGCAGKVVAVDLGGESGAVGDGCEAMCLADKLPDGRSERL